MSDHLRERGAVLRKLPMVRWDRCIRPGDGTLIAYGWIARDDGRSDFVCLSFLWVDDPAACEVVTSSAKHSVEITRLLFGEQAGHTDCERISDLPELVIG